MNRAVTIGSTIQPNVLGRVAFDAGLVGATPGAILRYLAYRAGGMTAVQARDRVLHTGQNLSAFSNRPAKERTSIHESAVADIKAKFPGKPVSWVLRYVAAIEAGADESLARTIADEIKPGRPRKTA